MGVIDKLASSLNRRDEVPNQELAKQIAATKDLKSIQELVSNLGNKSRGIQNDCIKVLYEIGGTDPALIAKYSKEFIALLGHKNNRLQWGAMTALSTITLENPDVIYKALPKIIEAANQGSVITKDYAVNILIKLCPVEQYSDKAFLLLNEQLLNSPANQLAMYAEKAMPVITGKNRKIFLKTLTSRLPKIEKETKRKRVEKVIRKISAD